MCSSVYVYRALVRVPTSKTSDQRGRYCVYMHIGGSLRVSLVLELGVFQYSSRNSRPKSPAFESVCLPNPFYHLPTPTAHPPTPPASGQCTSNRHIWTKSNVSYLNVSPSPTHPLPPPRRILGAICTFFTGPLLFDSARVMLLPRLCRFFLSLFFVRFSARFALFFFLFSLVFSLSLSLSLPLPLFVFLV